ncbi:MAG TPA: methylglyoxal synthase [Flavitalea sp.]|nr:methylglyoxal synthase [Flavitalea sp.]
MNSGYFKNIKRIAIVAYADTRKDLIEWSYSNKNILKNHIIISTARTASILEGTLNIPVLNLHHGKAGGYQQIKQMLEDGKIDIILFFGNPNKTHSKDSWFEELIKISINEDVVVAYNQATIGMLLTSIAIADTEIKHEPSYEKNKSH